MNRADCLRRLIEETEPWDIAVIGGGATGVGIAVDAASRGYRTCLLEAHDFGKGTSSRSTKLIHGGVRYLQQGNVALVMEALKERGILRQNAPHLVHEVPFIVPNYAWWEAPFYGIGMRVYDLLAGQYGFGKSRNLSTEEVLAHIPTLERKGLRGGVLYYDGQFDDARLLIDLAHTAVGIGAALVNYCPVTGLTRDAEGYVDGVTFVDADPMGAWGDKEKRRQGDKEMNISPPLPVSLSPPLRTLRTLRPHTLRARCVINAAGPFCDAVRQMEDAAAKPMIAPSQGVHVVLPREFLPGSAAIMVPHTADGRVLFAIPWHGHTLLGTTDTPVEKVELEPVATDAEINFILETAGRYLAKVPTRGDILATFAGIRPLVRASAGGSGASAPPGPGGGGGTAALSREHVIHVSPAGLLTIAGGKWTTYRKMAEDAVDHAATLARLPERACRTKELRIHGAPDAVTPLPAGGNVARVSRPCSQDALPPHLAHLSIYGTAATEILALIAQRPELAERLHPKLPYVGAEVVYAVEREMARTVEDVLMRRTRAGFLNERAAREITGRSEKLLTGKG